MITPLPTPPPGDPDSFWAVVVSGCSVIVNIIIAIVGAVVSWVRSQNSAEDLVVDRMTTLARDLDEKIDNTERRFGETVNALRTKLMDVELWNRDNLVSKNMFERFEDSVVRQLQEINKKLDRNQLNS